MSTNKASLIDTLRYGAIAGIAGGVAEVIWVSVYAAATGSDAAIVARGVTTAVSLNAMVPNASVSAGVTIHMLLAVGLGLVLALAWRELASRSGRIAAAPFGFGAAALAGVWAFNFFVALPVISPDFVSLLPYPVSLASKLLFGLAAADVLRRSATVRTAAATSAA